jgi:uncharacterized NAD(P)/FAD-binding protein YdhS
MGSRGLSVLEQLTALARHRPALRLCIDIFEPRAPGGGLHDTEQPDYLMLNTMAGQLAALSPAQENEPGGPTFLQWCNTVGIHLDDRGHIADSGGRPVGFGDFVPRRLLGRYLQDCYRWLTRRAPDNVLIRHHAEAIDQCRPSHDHTGFALTTASGWQHGCDALFLTVGHPPQAAMPSEVGRRVAIEGLGLTAMDALARLTQGRGGRFVASSGFARWRYQPSGDEPRLFLYSRSGLPFHARPHGAEPDREAWPALFFTAEALDFARHQQASGRLDFRRDVLPLIEDEMRAVFYQATVQVRAPEALTVLQRTLRGTVEPQERRTLFAALAARWGRFEPGDWMPVTRWSGQGADYARWFQGWIEQDLALSRLGLSGSPVNQALEVWRDHRGLLRRAADRNGLTDRSTLDLYGVWAGVSNRLVGGPQLERHEDLLALMEAGVVTLLPPGGQCAAPFDTVIRARVPHAGLAGRPEGLFADLLEQGLIRASHPWPADGIETDTTGRALPRDRNPALRLWVLGPAVEGCTFYNHYVPTPDPACAALHEARRAARACLDSLTGPVLAASCA